MVLRQYYTVALCLFIILPVNSFAQGKNYLGLNFGLSDFHIRDDHASPLFFRSIGITPSVQYRCMGESVIHSLELSYFYDYLSSINSNFNTDNWRGKAKYSYVHSITDTDFKVQGNKLRLFIGASASSFLSLSDYRYTDYNLAIKSWYWNHSLNVDLELVYSPNQKEYISAQLSTPVISNVSRPKYSPSENYSYTTNNYKVDTFGEIKYFPDNFFINTILTYHTPVSDRFSFQIDYEFFYSLYDKPKEVDMYMNNIRAGLFLGF